LKSRIAKLLYKLSVKYSYKVFFQNHGDKDYFVKNRLVRNNYEVISGSGVNLNDFLYKPMKFNGEITFLFIGRIMCVKGIDQYLQAAKTLMGNYNNIKFQVLGFIEEDSYNEI